MPSLSINPAPECPGLQRDVPSSFSGLRFNSWWLRAEEEVGEDSRRKPGGLLRAVSTCQPAAFPGEGSKCPHSGSSPSSPWSPRWCSHQEGFASAPASPASLQDGQTGLGPQTNISPVLCGIVRWREARESSADGPFRSRIPFKRQRLSFVLFSPPGHSVASGPRCSGFAGLWEQRLE